MALKLPLGQTLRQKLSSLSLSGTSSPNSPTSPRGHSTSDWSTSSRLSSSRRKGLFGWNRKDSYADEDEEYIPTDDDLEKVEAVIDKIICQAGVDYETRPMVVITAAALPDPRTTSYDLLLLRMLAHLDIYVENDYTVVFLAAGGRHTPGWNWVFQAYRSLTRKYRKNLKKLYIVHSTWFSKMLFSLAGAIISPKFFRKIQYISTLSELAANVPLTQIDIAPAVYQENLKFERQVTIPRTEMAAVFGVPLEALMGDHGENGGIPRVLKDCADYLRECGMEAEGLFRRSPNSAALRQAKEAYDRGHPVSLSAFGDPHIAAVLLKMFLRQLPQPIFPSDLYPILRNCPQSSSSSDFAAVAYIREQVLPALRSDAVEIVLNYVMHLLHEVSLRSRVNLMDAYNLALCVTPTLVGSDPISDLQMCTIPGGPTLFASPAIPRPRTSPAIPENGQTTAAMVVKICIERYFEIFEEVVDRSVPLYAGDQVTSSQTPTSSHFALGSDPAEDDSLDDQMLVMPVGPNPPSSSSPSPNVPGTSPPTAWRRVHRRVPSSLSSASVPEPAPSVVESGKSIGESARGTHRARRSLVGVESAVARAGSRGSITIGRGTATRSAGSGVEAVGITALGFFMPPVVVSETPSELSSHSGASNAINDGHSIRPTRSIRELSEVAE